MVRKECSQCGNGFHGLPENDTCVDCEFRRKNPDLNDGCWTWSRGGDRWDIMAYWPDDEPDPDPGQVVTVHRKDGSTSSVTILEVEGRRYLPNGRAQMRCLVQPR
jgi:hypothetical protein